VGAATAGFSSPQKPLTEHVIEHAAPAPTNRLALHTPPPQDTIAPVIGMQSLP
jgi:hypothetical protein